MQIQAERDYAVFGEEFVFTPTVQNSGSRIAAEVNLRISVSSVKPTSGNVFQFEGVEVETGEKTAETKVEDGAKKAQKCQKAENAKDSEGGFVCRIGNVAPGQSRSAIARIKISKNAKPGKLMLSADATTEWGAEAKASGTKRIRLLRTNPTALGVYVDLSVEMGRDYKLVNPGTEFGQRIRVRNNSRKFDATNVRLRFKNRLTAPGRSYRLSPIFSENCKQLEKRQDIYECTWENIPPEEEVDVSIEIVVDSPLPAGKSARLETIARVLVGEDEPDKYLVNNTAQIHTTVLSNLPELEFVSPAHGLPVLTLRHGQLFQVRAKKFFGHVPVAAIAEREITVSLFAGERKLRDVTLRLRTDATRELDRLIYESQRFRVIDPKAESPAKKSGHETIAVPVGTTLRVNHDHPEFPTWKKVNVVPGRW